MFATRPTAVEVSPGLLIGSAPERRQRRALARLGLDLIIDLCSDEIDDEGWPADIELVTIPLAGRLAPERETLKTLATGIADRISSGQRVLVHCHPSVRRSATVACAVLVGIGWSLADASQALRDCRGGAPTDDELILLADFEREMSSPGG